MLNDVVFYCMKLKFILKSLCNDRYLFKNIRHYKHWFLKKLFYKSLLTEKSFTFLYYLLIHVL